MYNTVVTKALLSLPGVSRKTAYKIYDKLGNFEDSKIVYELLKQILGNRVKDINYDDFLRSIDVAETYYHNAIKQNITLISVFDSDFPFRFRLIEDSPILIYAIGDLSQFNQSINVAIIGTREPTEYGKKIGERLGFQFSEKKCNVVSGLAIGCDTYAHKGCLSGASHALAVLPGGVDKVVPSSNRDLAKGILDSGGVLISEYPIGTKPFQGNYVDRDRLQSALSDGLVVVETGIKGGTLHTVGFAKKQSKLLACYKHPLKYHKEEKVQGNLALLSSGEAFGIQTEEDIDNYILQLKEKFDSYSKTRPLEQNSINKTQLEDANEQLTFGI